MKDKQLFLADFEGMTDAQVREYINENYGGSEGSRSRLRPDELDERFDILVAYESVGDWGCDSSSFFLLRERATGNLFENHASHCSCYGFEGQWSPEATSLEYLKSDSFSISAGGYDGAPEYHKAAVKEYIRTL